MSSGDKFDLLGAEVGRGPRRSACREEPRQASEVDNLLGIG